MNTAATAVAVHQSTQTDDQRDTDNERRRPYRCTVCPKAYTCSSGLKYHRQHAHPSSLNTALTNRQFNEQFVYHTTPHTLFPNYPSSPPRLPLPNDTILNSNNPNAPQNTTMHDNSEQLGNQLSTETVKF